MSLLDVEIVEPTTADLKKARAWCMLRLVAPDVRKQSVRRLSATVWLIDRELERRADEEST